MSTPDQTPRPITPSDQPVPPCWLWDGADREWRHFAVICHSHKDYTHWVPATPPPALPIAAAQPGIYTFHDSALGLSTDDRRTLTTELIPRPVGLTTARWYEFAGATCALLNARCTDREIERLKCAHSDMADLYAKEQVRAKRLADEIEGYRRDRNQAVEISEKLDGETTRLRGQLEAAEKRIQAFEQSECTTWAGWRAEADDLRRGLDNLRSLLGLPVNGGHNADRLHGLEVAVRDLLDTAKDAQDRLIADGLSSLRPASYPVKQVVRPWKAEEVPLGAWLKTREGAVAITEVCEGHLKTGEVWHSYEDLAALGYEHSADGGRTWHPAGVVEEVVAA